MMALQQNLIDFPNKLAPVLVGVYDSWEKFALISVTYRRGTISAIRAVSRMNYFQKTQNDFFSKTQKPSHFGAQNEKHPNEDMQSYLKIGK